MVYQHQEIDNRNYTYPIPTPTLFAITCQTLKRSIILLHQMYEKLIVPFS